MRILSLLLLSRYAVPSAADTDDSNYAWGGMFEVASDEDYIWVAQKVDGEYAASTLTFVMVPTDSTDEDDFEAAQATADPIFATGGGGSCEAAAAGDKLTPVTSGASCWSVTLESGDYESKWYLATSGVLPAEGKGGLAIFTDTAPGLFEENSHYLRDEEGHDVEAVHATDEEDHHDDEEDHDDEEGTPIGIVLLGCLVVNLVTLAGVALLGFQVVTPHRYLRGGGDDGPSPSLSSSFSGLSPLVDGGLNGFAAGALLACAAFLMALESSHMVAAQVWPDAADDEEDEVPATWRWGTAVLAGFLSPTVVHLLTDYLGLDAVACLRGGGLRGAAAAHGRAPSSGERPAVDVEDGTAKAAAAKNAVAARNPLSPPTPQAAVSPPTPQMLNFEGSASDLTAMMKAAGMTAQLEEAEAAATQVAAAAPSPSAAAAGGCGDPSCTHEHGPGPLALLPGADKAGLGGGVTHVSAASVAFAICFGDAMHNFTDGVLIGTAFKLCSSRVAWGMVAAACGHELAQEVADFVMLTSAPLRLPPLRALAVNFVIGLSVVVGGLLVSAVDMSDGTLGLMLAFGAGSYVYLGATVSLPTALSAGGHAHAHAQAHAHAHALGEPCPHNSGAEAARERKHTATVLAAFVLGAVAIGLILIDHEHCDAGHGHGEHGDELEDDAHGH